MAFDQLDGTLTSRLREMDASLLELIAPLEASLDFPDEGYHFVARDAASRDPAHARRASTPCWPTRARPGDSRRLTAAIVGGPNAGNPASSIGSPAPRAPSSRTCRGPRGSADRAGGHRGVPFTFVDTRGLRERRRTPSRPKVIAARA
jgi:tRNA modification GTPase